MEATLRRSAFLSSAAALSAVAFLQQVPLAAKSATTVTNDLTPIVETLLPFGTPSFPAVQSADVVTRVEGLFQLSESPVFQGSLRGFLSLASFSTGSDQLFGAEMAALPEADVHRLAANDAAAFASLKRSTANEFRELDPSSRTAYVGLWRRSAFSTRRRFYGSLRAVTFVAFYSLPESWPAIGYAGPVLGAHDR